MGEEKKIESVEQEFKTPYFIGRRHCGRAPSFSKPSVHVRRVRSSAPRCPSFPVIVSPGSTSRSGPSLVAGERRREVARASGER